MDTVFFFFYPIYQNFRLDENMLIVICLIEVGPEAVGSGEYMSLRDQRPSAVGQDTPI
jgi:hypothetical protein